MADPSMPSAAPRPEGSLPPRSAELGALVRLALPAVATQLAQMGMGVLDTVMAGRVSAEDLAGVALGGNVIWPTMLLLMGVLMALTPNIAQLRGEGRREAVGPLVHQGFWMALLLGGLILLLIDQAPKLYHLLGADPKVIPYAERYLDAARWGLPGIMFYFVGRYLCDGMGDTRPAMYVAVFALGLKGLLNWVFIFGHWGAPALGGAGCGLAMAITMWFEAAAMLWLLGRLPAVRGTNLFTRPRGPAWGTLGQLLRLGTPIGLASFFEMAAFSLVTLLVARFGATAVAAQQIAFSVNGIIFMLPMGLGIAATIRIGHALGEGRPEAARRAAEVAIAAAVGVGIAAALILLGAREGIAHLYTREGDVALLSATLLLFVAVYIIVDSAQATAMGALRGYKDTRGPMLIAFGGYWLFALPLGTALGLGWVPGIEALGVYGFWIGLSLGLALVAGGLLWRLLRRSHRATLPA